MQLSQNELKRALDILATDASVFVPATVDKVKKFVIWDGKTNVELGGVNAELPPKDILFPSTEKMYAYHMGENIEVKEIINNPKQIIFGIRPCDVRSIECMDKVFFEKKYVDSFYARKRENTIIMAIGCTESTKNCFCESMGLNPNESPAADVMMYLEADSIVMHSQSDKGKAILDQIKDVLRDGINAKSNTSCKLEVGYNDEMPKKLLNMFEHPIWKEVAGPCIGCATCTYVCPTCYCFDIDSDNHGSEGTKLRCWDSCMFSDYSRMAGGHNPRPSKTERVRNRYLHKLSYFNERYDMTLCVGCGRCIDKCPAHMNIAEFIDRVKEVE